MSSETKYGIMKQPPPICPLIDAVIEKFNENNDVVGHNDLLECKKLLEEIRISAILLREWGAEWKSMSKEIIAQLEVINSLYKLPLDSTPDAK